VKAISDALLRRSGVAHVRVDLQANLVHVEPDAGVAFALRSIPDAIAAAGFKPGPMAIEAHGVFQGTGDARTFRITGWSDPIPADADVTPGADGTLRAAFDWRADPPRLRAANSR